MSDLRGWPADERGKAFVDENGVVHIVSYDGTPIAQMSLETYQRLRASLDLQPAVTTEADG